MPKTKKKQEAIERFPVVEDLIFALDIGTRTIVGIAGFYENNCFKVVGTEVVEHRSRAMLDGQIHDIEKVAEVVAEVKGKLEKSLGRSLTKVAVAAAGRVLRTSQFKLEYEIEQGREIDAEIVGSLEIDAVQNARFSLDSKDLNEDKVPFYCVGYSVVNYYLNGYVISSLIGQKGKKIGVEVLATFLPNTVVDSLYTVMSKVGLEVISLTLEPIAAISVTIPKDLRLLNLVLVDIGAGTSDIAITKDGSVVAYGMVPTAGDEITEKISQEFLVDFNTAEKIKISISSGAENIKFTDILGKKCEVDMKKALEVIEPAIDSLAAGISEKILEFNAKAPNAVFLIGGGSQLPGLSGKIADRLGLLADRVAVRGRDVIKNIKTKGKKLSGPESITPFGIAMMAYSNRGQDFMTVSVNGERIRLLNSKKLTVSDALIPVGFNPEMLLGRSGKPLKFVLNGKPKNIRGEPGTAAEIYVNDSLASLDTPIRPGDSIHVKPAYNGKNAQKTIAEYVHNPQGINIIFNDEDCLLVPRAVVNGKAVDLTAGISEADDIILDEIVTLSDFAVKMALELKGYEILINGVGESLDYVLKNKDSIKYFVKSADKIYGTKVLGEKTENGSGKNTDREDKVACRKSEEGAFVILVNGQQYSLKEGRPYIFVDVFNYINFDLSAPKGTIVLKLNGKPANFTDSIHPGDTIEIYWENS